MSDHIPLVHTSATWFDYLPVEIILYVFDYLSPHDILHSFVDLSPRLCQLILKQHHVLNPLHLPTSNPHFWCRVLPLIESHIQSLIIVHGHLVEWLDLFTHLASLTISFPDGLSIGDLDHTVDSKAFARLRTLKIKDETMVGWPIHESRYDAEHKLFRAVLSDANQLEVFDYAPKLGSLKRRKLYGLVRNASIRSLTLHLHEFGEVLTILQCTPNLRHLDIHSSFPLRTEYRRSWLQSEDALKQIGQIELEEFILRLDGPDEKFLDDTWQMIAFDAIISTLEIFSSSLITLSLHFSYLDMVTSDYMFPLNGVKLEECLLRSMVKLENFYLCVQTDNVHADVRRILSTFRTQFWLDHQWTIGAHQTTYTYVYTLPFSFHELENFGTFAQVSCSNGQMQMDHTRLWSNVTSLELLVKDGTVSIDFLRSVQINMPRLRSIGFFGKGHLCELIYLDQPAIANGSHALDVKLSCVTTVRLKFFCLEKLTRRFFDTFPSFKHLILAAATWPETQAAFDSTFNENLQRLELNCSFKFERFVKMGADNLSNLQELIVTLSFTIEKFHREERTNAILHLFANLPKLKLLTIYVVPSDPSFFYPHELVWEPIVTKLKAADIGNRFKIEPYRTHVRIVKKALF